MSDQSELERAYDIYDPWLAVNKEREPWVLTLKSGKRVQLLLPLGAAVELEEKGFDIKAGVLTRSEWKGAPSSNTVAGPASKPISGPSDRPISGPSTRPL